MTDVRAVSVFDIEYYLNRAAEKAPGGYYLSAAIHGERPGIWSGAGALALGFTTGQVVVRDDLLNLYDMTDPRTGEKLPGRAPAHFRKYAQILGELLDAEPEATGERRRQLEREAAQAVRRVPYGTDVTVGWVKSIGIVHGSMREKARQARLAKDEEAAALWAKREERWSDLLQEANQAGLRWLEKHAGFTRRGYGARVRDDETIEYTRAGMVITSWLQGTSREGDVHDHDHNVIARMGVGDDGVWRSVDTMAIRHHLPGFRALVDIRTRAALTRDFGVRWVKRDDDYGYEIDGVSLELIELYSKRTTQVKEREDQLGSEFEGKYGRRPNARELKFLADEATLASRRGKEDDLIDWDALAAKWDAESSGQLAGIGDQVCEFGGSLLTGPPSREVQQQAIQDALAFVQRKHSTWSRSELMYALCRKMGQEFCTMDPDAAAELLEQLANEALSTVQYGVTCLEAPQWPPLPQALIRELDGRSIFKRPGTTRYAAHGHLEMEEKLLQQAQQRGAPALPREFAARRLGASADELEAVLDKRAQDASELTRTGLRMDQAAIAYWALTSGQRVSVGVGPAGSGKTHMAAATAGAWRAAGHRVVGLATASAARNVLIDAGIPESYNTKQFLIGIENRRIGLSPDTMLIIDEASMTSMSDLAAIVDLAERRGAKVFMIGDHGQLSAVEQGGGFKMLADHLGFTQLAIPVRFKEPWERTASLQLRTGDKEALEAYSEHGRIVGLDREGALDFARHAYVADYVTGDKSILMAQSREDCRTLGRLIRDDLVHLGYVDGAQEAEISHHGVASAGDLIVNLAGSHQVTDSRHELANGDIFLVESVTPMRADVTDGGAVVRRLIDYDSEGRPVFAGETTFLTRQWLRASVELGYAVTGHKGQGQTVKHGWALITGSESRNWLYVAMSRGWLRNTAITVTHQAAEEIKKAPTAPSEVHAIPERAADPRPGTRAAIELARYQRMRRERLGLPQEKQPVPEDARLAIGVLADVIDCEEAEPSAAEYRDHALSDADHLALLHAEWQNLAGRADRARYEQLVLDAVPWEFHGEMAEVMTWLCRGLRAAEMAGQDPGKVIRAAVNPRPLTGSRHSGKVLLARLNKLTDPMVPLAPRPFSERIPEFDDPEVQAYVTERAEMMDERIVRLGEHQAEHPDPWALNALGVVPGDPVERLDWAQRASKIAAFREIAQHHDQADPVGEEPAKNPELRAWWFDAQRAMADTGKLDLSQLPDRTLLNMRDGYALETGWAPPDVSGLLSDVRLGAESMRIEAQLADARAQAAKDDIVATRQRTIVSKARRLEARHYEREDLLERTMEDRREWDDLTKGPRGLALQADTAYRERHPKARLQPLRSAEPQVPEDALKRPDWLAGLTEQRAKFREEADRRLGLRVPDVDHEMKDLGEAYPIPEPQREAILQPAPHEMKPSERVLAAREPERADPELELQ
jgi:conjugative relaxase-like TrwC/TraI family protein